MAIQQKHTRGKKMNYTSPKIVISVINELDIISTSMVLPEMPLQKSYRGALSDTDNTDYGTDGIAEN